MLLEGDERKEGCRGGSHQGKSGKSGADWFLTERSPLPGAAAEASTPTVGVGASTLSQTGLALFGAVRCVGLNRDFEE